MANRDTHNRTLQPLPGENRTIFELRDQGGRPYSVGYCQMLQGFFAASEEDIHADGVPFVALDEGVMYVDFRNHDGTAPYDTLRDETLRLWMGAGQLAIHADVHAFVVDANRAAGEPSSKAFQLNAAVDVTPEVVAELDELNSSPLATETGLTLDDELLFLLHGE